MTLLRCIILLLFTTSLAFGQAAGSKPAISARSEAAELVRKLYKVVVDQHPMGIGGAVPLFGPYLSKAMLHRIDINDACQKDWDRQYPDKLNNKPPFVEFGLFTGGNERERPNAFHIDKVQAKKDGSFFVYVTLALTDIPDDLFIWRVAAIVVREKDHFVVDDVIWLKEYPQDVDVRLSKYLTSGCNGPRWVGDNDKRSKQKPKK